MEAASAREDAVSPIGPYDVPQPLAGEIWRVQISTKTESGLARDDLVITPHFQNNATATPGALADRIAASMPTYLTHPVEGQVKVYREDYAPPGTPHNPLAIRAFGNVGQYLSIGTPRELCVCLSYYAAINAPRFRGRLYIPLSWANNHVTPPSPAAGKRPDPSVIAAVMAFYTVVIKDAMTGTGVQWVVSSRTDKSAKVVSNYWVDDEWDIIRSRGLRGTTRQQGTAP